MQKLPNGWSVVSGLKYGLHTIKVDNSTWVQINEDLTIEAGKASVPSDVYLNLIRSVNCDPVYALAKRITSPTDYAQLFDDIDELRKLICKLEGDGAD